MIFSRQDGEFFLWEISIGVGSVRKVLNARGAVRKSPKFLLLSSAPLQAAFWQRREEPVKALRFTPTADSAPAAALTEPSRP